MQIIDGNQLSMVQIGNRNKQYIDIEETGITISFTNEKTGDKSIHVYRENYEYVYSVTYEYEK